MSRFQAGTIGSVLAFAAVLALPTFAVPTAAPAGNHADTSQISHVTRDYDVTTMSIAQQSPVTYATAAPGGQDGEPWW